MLILTIFITAIYTLLIGVFIVGFFRVKNFNESKNTPKNSFSIIIPFRDEAKNLPDLLKSLSQLEYPTTLFEVILVDDDSTDNGKSIITDFKTQYPTLLIQVLNNISKSKSPKKDAIETAIQKSTFEWVITTDADCNVPKKWLLLFDDFIQENTPQMICAPVTYQVKNTFLEQFQLLDFISLIGTTIGAFGINKPFLCNGANLCYSKKVFSEVNGFEGNHSISSGDDIFLLEKVLEKYPTDVHFIKSNESIVNTKPEPTLKKLIQQRIRWASKTSATNNGFGKFAGVMVLLMNLLIIVLLISSILGVSSSYYLFWAFSFKFIIDFILILKTFYLTNQSKNILFYPIIAILYPLFIVFVSFFSILKKNVLWKKRRIFTK
ncbi:MAG: glycosyltransferase [Flavobacteriaceae bacterium]